MCSIKNIKNILYMNKQRKMGATMNQKELDKLYRELQERKAKGIYKNKRSNSSSALSTMSTLTAISTTSSVNRYTPWHDGR